MEEEVRLKNEPNGNNPHFVLPMTARKRAGIRVSHRQHTGRKLPAYHTSYALLFFVLVLTGLTLLFARQKIVQAGPPQVQNGDIGLSGVVPGAPPSTAANLTQPSEGQSFSSNIITVSGSCEAGYIVEIYRNAAFAGSDICAPGGTFSLQVTIIEGKNTLLARTRDSLDQYGPDSTQIIVTLVLSEDSTSENTGDSSIGESSSSSKNSSNDTELPLLIFTESVQRGVQPEQNIQVAYEIEGGQPPYAVLIDWGDSSSAAIAPHKKSGDFSGEHSFLRPGQYKVSLRVNDSADNSATIQTIVIVNGETNKVFSFAAITCGLGSDSSSALLCSAVNGINSVWPAFLITSSLTVSFWLGEKVVYWRIGRSMSSVAK